MRINVKSMAVRIISRQAYTVKQVIAAVTTSAVVRSCAPNMSVTQSGSCDKNINERDGSNQ